MTSICISIYRATRPRIIEYILLNTMSGTQKEINLQIKVYISRVDVTIIIIFRIEILYFIMLFIFRLEFKYCEEIANIGIQRILKLLDNDFYRKNASNHIVFHKNLSKIIISEVKILYLKSTLSVLPSLQIYRSIFWNFIRTFYYSQLNILLSALLSVFSICNKVTNRYLFLSQHKWK